MPNSSNITISSLGGSATSTVQVSNGKTSSKTHELQWVCSYSSAGVLTITHKIKLLSTWGNYSTSHSSAYATVSGSTQYFLKNGSSNASGTGTVVTVGVSKSWTVKNVTSISVSWVCDIYSGGYGPGSKLSGSFTITVPKVATYTACGAPTWKSGNGSTFYSNLCAGTTNGNVTVTWNAGTAGTNNSVTGYIIQARYPKEGTQNSYDSNAWYEKWNGTGTSATLNFDGWASSACDIQLRIRTKGSAGSSYYSGWSSTIYVRSLGRTNPSAPTSAAWSKSTIYCGESYRITVSGASAGVNAAITGYEWQWKYDSNSWTSAGSTTTAYLDDTIGSYSTSNRTLYWRVRTKGAGGTYSSWKSFSHVITARTLTTVGTLSVRQTSSGRHNITWSGFKAGTNNAFTRYILYLNCYINSTTTTRRLSYVKLTEPTLTQTSYSVRINENSNFRAGDFYEFRLEAYSTDGKCVTAKTERVRQKPICYYHVQEGNVNIIKESTNEVGGLLYLNNVYRIRFNDCYYEGNLCNKATVVLLVSDDDGVTWKDFKSFSNQTIISSEGYSEVAVTLPSRAEYPGSHSAVLHAKVIPYVNSANSGLTVSCWWGFYRSKGPNQVTGLKTSSSLARSRELTLNWTAATLNYHADSHKTNSHLNYYAMHHYEVYLGSFNTTMSAVNKLFTVSEVSTAIGSSSPGTSLVASVYAVDNLGVKGLAGQIQIPFVSSVLVKSGSSNKGSLAHIFNNSSWKPVKKIYVYSSGAWKLVQ